MNYNGKLVKKHIIMRKLLFPILIIFANYGYAQHCLSGDCNNGPGVYTWATGEKYDGQWKNSEREGTGEAWWSDGAYYAGTWANGKMMGFGKFVYPNKSIFIGRMINSIPTEDGYYYD